MNSIQSTWYASNATTSTIDVWPIWTNQTTIATSTYYDPWTQWVSAGQQQAAQSLGAYFQPQQQQRSAEEAAEHARQAEEMLANAKRIFERAEALLLAYLDAEQAKEYREKKSFRVCSKQGTAYRIRCTGTIGNVDKLNERGEVVERLCAHDRRHGTPEPDQWLAQMLHLRHHEQEFLRVANRH